MTIAGGCAVGPRYHKPETPANAGYAPTPLAETSSSAPIRGGDVQHFISGRDLPFEWWQLFQSQALNALIDRPEALVFDPALVTRLRRQRARRHRMRSAGPDRRDGTPW